MLTSRLMGHVWPHFPRMSWWGESEVPCGSAAAYWGCLKTPPPPKTKQLRLRAPRVSRDAQQTSPHSSRPRSYEATAHPSTYPLQGILRSRGPPYSRSVELGVWCVLCFESRSLEPGAGSREPGRTFRTGGESLNLSTRRQTSHSAGMLLCVWQKVCCSGVVSCCGDVFTRLRL